MIVRLFCFIRRSKLKKNISRSGLTRAAYWPTESLIQQLRHHEGKAVPDREPCPERMT